MDSVNWDWLKIGMICGFFAMQWMETNKLLRTLIKQADEPRQDFPANPIASEQDKWLESRQDFPANPIASEQDKWLESRQDLPNR